MNKSTQDIWLPDHTFVVVPTNLEGVMGRGLSKQLADKCPELAKKLRFEGKNGYTTRRYWDAHCTNLEFYLISDHEDRWVVLFPVKESWKDEASLLMISRSLLLLGGTLNIALMNRQCLVPLVGCGFGELKPENVIPIIEERLDSFGDRCVLILPDPSLVNKYPDSFKPGWRADKSVVEPNI